MISFDLSVDISTSGDDQIPGILGNWLKPVPQIFPKPQDFKSPEATFLVGATAGFKCSGLFLFLNF